MRQLSDQALDLSGVCPAAAHTRCRGRAPKHGAGRTGRSARGGRAIPGDSQADLDRWRSQRPCQDAPPNQPPHSACSHHAIACHYHLQMRRSVSSRYSVHAAVAAACPAWFVEIVLDRPPLEHVAWKQPPRGSRAPPRKTTAQPGQALEASRALYPILLPVLRIGCFRGLLGKVQEPEKIPSVWW